MHFPSALLVLPNARKNVRSWALARIHSVPFIRQVATFPPVLASWSSVLPLFFPTLSRSNAGPYVAGGRVESPMYYVLSYKSLIIFSILLC